MLVLIKNGTFIIMGPLGKRRAEADFLWAVLLKAIPSRLSI